MLIICISNIKSFSLDQKVKIVGTIQQFYIMDRNDQQYFLTAMNWIFFPRRSDLSIYIL